MSRYEDWMRQAERNLKSAKVNYEVELYEEVCFEAHQAAEKALKALLNYLNKGRRGASVTFLVKESGLQLDDDLLNCLKYLDKHYIPTRYPDVYDEGAPCDYYTREDADRCLSCANLIVEWVTRVVGKALTGGSPLSP